MLRGEVWRGARQARRSRAAGLCSLMSVALYGWFSRARVFPPFWFARLIGSTLSQRDQFDMRRVGVMVQRRSSRCVHTHSDDAANQNIASKTYAYLMQCVGEGYARAQALGKTFSVPAVHWWQGEGDYGLGPVSFEYYLGALKKLRTDIEADVRAIVPDHPPVVLIVNQSLSHAVKGQSVPSVDLAMLQASIDDPYIVLAGPMYAYPAADNGHYTAQGYKHMGAIDGVAYKRTVNDGEKWEPLRPISLFAQGNVAVIQFKVPKGPLVLDTVAISNPGDYGFIALGPGGEARDITSVSLIGSDRVKIVADGPIGKVRYAWTGGNFTGPLAGPRGCLRDSQGDTIKLDPTGLNLPLHNWCVLFEI